MIMFVAAPGEVADDGDQRNSHIGKPNEVSVMLKDVIHDATEATQGKQRPQQLAAMKRKFYFR
jgi:hypothetical protein